VSLSLERVYSESVKSGDPHIFSLISSVSGHIVDTALFEEFALRILVHQRKAHA